MIGLSGKKYKIESKPFSSGGEGDIYNVIGDKKHVIKVYHKDRISSELENKIRYMSKNPPESGVLNQVAWPIDALYDSSNTFVGFVMPRLDINAELGDVYVYPPSKPESRIAYNYKLILAMNICTVINAVHSAGYIFGDFNPRNIGINMENGKVAFLDTDSYHIVLDESNNKAYRCKVCLDGYVAPELLKQCEPYKKDAYENAPLPTFTVETDNFALAVHMFKLLMNGYTPFNGIKENETASTASPGIGNQAIKRDSYCFKAGNKPQAAAVPPSSILPDKIKKLFDRAFIDGKNNPKKRPSAQEWYYALSDYEKSLVACSKKPAHMYKKGLSVCPWCQADERYQKSINPTLTQRSFPLPVATTPVSLGYPATANSPATTQPSKVNSAVSNNVKATPKKLSYQERISKVASVLYPLSWIVFIANIMFCLAPFVSNGSISFESNLLYGVDSRIRCITSLISVALMCFSTELKCASSVGTVFSWIWSFFCCFGVATIRYTQMGFNASSASETWKLFGILLVSFAATLICSSKFGVKLRQGRSNGSPRIKQKLKAIDVVSLIVFIGITAFCIPLLLNLNKLFAFIGSYNLVEIGIWVVPILIIIFYAVSNTGNEIVGSWLCVSMAVLFEIAVLNVSRSDIIGGILLWIGLAIAALLFIAYINENVDNAVSRITTVSFFVFFIAGAFTDITIHSDGVGAVGVGARWWTIMPAIIDVAIAIIFSIIELFRK